MADHINQITRFAGIRDAYMRRLFILFGLLLSHFLLKAQQDFFLFFQSENNQPYYVQMNDRTFSSSSVGHLIISGLRDSVYTLAIGFPKDKFPEQLFQIRINKKDAGYQIKNMGADGWSLSNFQTLQLIKARTVESKKQTIAYGDIKKTDVFSTLMAGLVNDSAVLYTFIAKVAPAKEDSKTSLVDTADTKTEIVVKQEELPGKDTFATKGDLTKQEISPNDTLVTRTGISKQQDIPIKDTPVVEIEVTKQQQVPKADTAAASEVVKTSEVKNRDSSEAAIAAATAKDKQTVDSGRSQAESATARIDEQKNKEARLLIVSLGETKTSMGTEMVFFDMSSPGKTDTIKLLIPNDRNVIENTQPVKVPTGENSRPPDSTVAKTKGTIEDRGITSVEKVDKKEEDQKGRSGKRFGNIFRRRDKSSASGSDKAEKAGQASTIKVTDVEVKSPGTHPDSINEKRGAKRVQGKNSDPDKINQNPESGQKSGAGKFMGKIFGKKSKAQPSGKEASGKTESDQNASSVKVTATDSPASQKTQKPAGVANSDCKSFASDADLDRLRIKMLGEKDADGQIIEARKFFKTKCFSTKQIRTLSELFRNDEGRYKLFDAAYPFVSDTNNFKDLAGLLSDKYYINRFNAMVRL